MCTRAHTPRKNMIAKANLFCVELYQPVYAHWIKVAQHRLINIDIKEKGIMITVKKPNVLMNPQVSFHDIHYATYL